MQMQNISPDLLRWARGRANLSLDEISSQFPDYAGWEAGTSRPDLKDLQKFSKVTQTPFGYFFLDAPPNERLPINDFRTVGDKGPRRPSPGLLETIQTMQRRQNWLRDELIEEGVAPLPFVGIAKGVSDSVAIAAMIRETLGLERGWASAQSNWQKAFAELRNRVEAVGILVVKNGVVGNDTHRKLDASEFRGFVLCDEYAPLIFVNGRDAESAQMFTLAHELAHIWIGRDGVFDLANLQPAEDRFEKLCNEIAAELLVPAQELLAFAKQFARVEDHLSAISHHFRVSPIVAARRALDVQLITRDAYFRVYRPPQKADGDDEGPKGGNFYSTQYSRLGRRFFQAIVRATKEGRLLFRDAYQLTDLHGNVFDTFADRIESGNVE